LSKPQEWFSPGPSNSSTSLSSETHRLESPFSPRRSSPSRRRRRRSQIPRRRSRAEDPTGLRLRRGGSGCG